MDTVYFGKFSTSLNKIYFRAWQPVQDRPEDTPLCPSWRQCRPGLLLLPGQSQPVQRQVVQGEARVLQVHASGDTTGQGLPGQGNENKCKYFTFLKLPHDLQLVFLKDLRLSKHDWHPLILQESQTDALYAHSTCFMHHLTFMYHDS